MITIKLWVFQHRRTLSVTIHTNTPKLIGAHRQKDYIFSYLILSCVYRRYSNFANITSTKIDHDRCNFVSSEINVTTSKSDSVIMVKVICGLPLLTLSMEADTSLHGTTV